MHRHERRLHRAEPLLRKANVAGMADSRVHAVDGLAGGERTLHDRSARAHPLERRLFELDAAPCAIDASSTSVIGSP